MEDMVLPKDPSQWPSSARMILRHLEDGPLTNKDLVDKTGFARRSLARTLKRLTEASIVDRKPSLQDTRRFYYVLKAGKST